ncbi:ATP-binding protein [Nocardioides mesophilus]|uniref:ATP-binding protein n=1 Tax=Nocardioides mesophilus TaxID=433659 RepID=A0A7G9RB52_9ACTN|nr:ATP-binding protein [Nocardioides mesophilus]QNN52827.1 ATP-binding protein [Nocardioides mesophilus]
MDWYLDGDDAGAVSALRREVADYLRRHAATGGEIDDAELVVSELLGNTARHAAGPVWVTLAWQASSPVLTVSDLGPGFDPAQVVEADGRDIDPLQESGRGLFLINHLAPAMQAVQRATSGMRVSVTLPVVRRPEASYDPPRRTTGSLPSVDEAQAEGGFGRETFLRALVVQMAQTLEFQHGPDAAEAAVAQVGADVGGQMEEEFRVAERIVGTMTPEQMAACYVRLKHAIDGGFYVIDVSEERIVLGNTRCPFGEAVRRAPSLCRMTSSVFGGSRPATPASR